MGPSRCRHETPPTPLQAAVKLSSVDLSAVVKRLRNTARDDTKTNCSALLALWIHSSTGSPIAASTSLSSVPGPDGHCIHGGHHGGHPMMATVKWEPSVDQPRSCDFQRIKAVLKRRFVGNISDCMLHMLVAVSQIVYFHTYLNRVFVHKCENVVNYAHLTCTLDRCTRSTLNVHYISAVPGG